MALRLGHRASEDFDFFSSTPFEPSTLQSQVAFLRDLSMSSFTQFKTNTLTAVVDRGGGVQVSFFGGLKLNRIDDPELAEGSVRLASLLDLAGTKAGTIYSRLASKDYLDLCALIEHGLSLATILGAGLAVYGSEYKPALTVRAMMYFNDLEGPALSDTQRTVLSRAAASVQLNRIPVLTWRRGLSASKESNANT